MFGSECCVSFDCWCGRRSRVFEAHGSPQMAVTSGTHVLDRPRKGKASMKRNVLVAFFALLFAPLFSHAQGLGSLLGRVTDPAGAGVAGARGTAIQEGTEFSRAAATDTDGFDMQLAKNFLITERWRLQLRVEYFNVFNHPNFAPEGISTGTVNSTDNITSFDKISSNSFGTFWAGQAGDPRVAQLAVKVFF
jgi:hypothetical protein